jgi:hypothetical protein
MLSGSSYVRATHDEFLTLRLPRDLRAALDGEARAAGVKVSVATRIALAVGLASIRSHHSPDPCDPSPAGPAAQMQVAA